MCRSIAIKRNYFPLSDYFSGQLIKSQLVFDMYVHYYENNSRARAS